MKFGGVKGDCPGNDAGGHKGGATWAECKKICLENSSCNYFVFWDTPNGSGWNCYPKSVCTSAVGTVDAKMYDPYDITDCGKKKKKDEKKFAHLGEHFFKTWGKKRKHHPLPSRIPPSPPPSPSLSPITVFFFNYQL